MERMDHIIRYYFTLGLHYKYIVNILKVKYAIYLSERQLKRILKKYGLRRNDYTDIGEVAAFIERQSHISTERTGYRLMHLKCKQAGLNVSRDIVAMLIGVVNPTGVRNRRKGRLTRRVYFARGSNYIWHVDSYDKLTPFGFCINGCIDGFSRKIIWLEVGETNSCPKVISSYFLSAVEEIGGVPLYMRGDRGTENGHIAQMQQFLLWNETGTLFEDSSFIYGTSQHNQRIESWWVMLRTHCMDFWIRLFHEMKNDGNFEELLAFKRLWNAHQIRSTRATDSPSGSPIVMYELPHLYGVNNCMQPISFRKLNICKSDSAEPRYITDEDVGNLAEIYMEEEGLVLSRDVFRSLQIYSHLRRKIRADLRM